MNKNIKILFTLLLSFFLTTNVIAQDENLRSILERIEAVQSDIKTLEKAVYSSESTTTSDSFQNEDVLTKHLLKLTDLEEQFQLLTNRFEEIIFKLDKISNRITKIQSDNQLRFQDLEANRVATKPETGIRQEEKLPGTGEAQDLGRISNEAFDETKQVQKTQSIETTGTVILEETYRVEKILPENKTPEEQYEFATSFLKVGDYETAELALREFVDVNSKHDLAGSAQYWYGETFRIRQLYQDAATAYLDGYQKYPKSAKGPINLLKLGVTLVQIGEKEQGCLMIIGVHTQYPKANQSVIQKAKYEEKKYKCGNQES